MQGFLQCITVYFLFQIVMLAVKTYYTYKFNDRLKFWKTVQDASFYTHFFVKIWNKQKVNSIYTSHGFL